MDDTELCYSTAGQLSRLIRAKEVSPVEIVRVHLERIHRLEPSLNSFISLLPERALASARQAEEEILSGNYRGPLHGIPIGLKDLYYTMGVKTTSGSRIFDDFIPSYDSTIMERFKQAGAILLGKLNMHQFAYGPVGENPDYGHMHNPWDLEMITGGSSGGSGSAARAGECTITMGTDTGGSIRIPSALCGLAGLKPTYGLLSRHGIFPLSWSLDHAGPMARTVEDCALILNATAGYDYKDPASASVHIHDYTSALDGDLKGMRIGVPKEYFQVPMDHQVEQAVRTAIDLLGELGATVREISWPMYRYAQAISSTIVMAEAAAIHRKMLRQKAEQYSQPVRLRIEAGFFISGADYLRAQQARTLFIRQSKELFSDVDLLAGPTVAITAHPIGANQVKVGEAVLGSTVALTQYTRPFNINGFPAITLPCGFSTDGLPIGLQLAGAPFDEMTVLKASHAYEQATSWHKKRPPLD
jgi:aspartyl-tRNA(Asn)/glutamyl-tRNA(Gln) amidotransferase subunit A